MSMASDNPRAVIGSNTGDAPDYAKLESERLQKDYGELFVTVAELLADAEKTLADPAKPKVVSLIKLIRDTTKRIVAYHEMEKQPHFRRGQAVDQTFFGLHDLLAKREKKGRPGIGDLLQQWLTDYDVRELAIENARRRQEALDARKEADQALAESENAEREAAAARRRAEEAAAAAARARKPETVQARLAEAAAATQEAEKATDVAHAAKGDAAVAGAQAERAYIGTLARPADVMRQRHDDGSMSTMETEKFAEITDRSALLADAAKLWPFLALADLEKALRGYANSHAYSNDSSVQLAGAKFGKRPKSRVR